MVNTNKKIALVLGGGGSRGAYEIGVWQALKELGVKIDMVMGTSVGAINGLMIVQDDLENSIKLWKELETNMIFDINPSSMKKDKKIIDINLGNRNLEELLAYAKEMITDGGAGNSGLREILTKFLDEEKFMESTMDYGLVTASFPSLEMHCHYKDNLSKDQIIDYVLASASCFPAAKIHEIDKQQYIDGGYCDNLPVEMAINRGATHIIAVDLQAVGVIRKEILAAAPNLTLIKSHWDLGNFLIFDKNNSRRIIRLGYLDAMKALGIFDGQKYTFAKGEIYKKSISFADAVANIFDLDSQLIYKRQIFNEVLSQKINEHIATMDEIKAKDLSALKKAILGLGSLPKVINQKSITLFLANKLKTEPEIEKYIRSRSLKKIIGEEIKAAQYLVDLI